MDNYIKMEISDKDLIRFMSKVKFFEKDKCWEWIGYKTPKGYPQFRFNGKCDYAHRVSYLISKGEIADGLYICHKCDNPSCVNPDHLWAGTQKDNMQDSILKNRNKESKKTHCKRGHPFSGENLKIYKVKNRPARFCKICIKIRSSKNKNGL